MTGSRYKPNRAAVKRRSDLLAQAQWHSADWFRRYFEDYWDCDFCEALPNRWLMDWAKDELRNHFPLVPEMDRRNIFWRAIGMSKEDCWG